MTEEDFEKRIEEAKQLLVRFESLPRKSNMHCIGTCDVIETISFYARVLFNENFNPGQSPGIKVIGYWLNNNASWNLGDKMTPLERRLVFLESFKGFCLAHESYKEW